MSSNGAVSLGATFARRARNATRDVKPDGQCIANGCMLEVVNILEGAEPILSSECRYFLGTRGRERLYICDEVGYWTLGALYSRVLLVNMGE